MLIAKKKKALIIKKHSKQLANMFSGILQSVVVYTLNEGIFLLRKYEKFNDEIIYGDVLSTARSKLYYLISGNSKIKITNKNNFVVNDINIKGEDYGIMVFG